MAIVFTGHILLAIEQRKNEYRRTLGKLFFFILDEMADISFNGSLSILMDALIAILQEILRLSDARLAIFTADFDARLSKYLQNAFHP